MAVLKQFEADASNPGVTLSVLDAFRFTPHRNADGRLDRAVANLLAHWKTRRPLRPCAFGIGTLFGKTEYPFLRYNLFFYVHVLSFYDAAKRREELRAALADLTAKTRDGALVVETPTAALPGSRSAAGASRAAWRRGGTARSSRISRGDRAPSPSTSGPPEDAETAAERLDVRRGRGMMEVSGTPLGQGSHVIRRLACGRPGEREWLEWVVMCAATAPRSSSDRSTRWSRSMLRGASTWPETSCW